MDSSVVKIAYLVSAALFIIGLRGMSHPRTAVRGNTLSALGMALALIVTLFQVDSFGLLLVGLVIGSAVGAILAYKIQMTAMPELVALYNGFGGIASALVAGAVLHGWIHGAEQDSLGVVEFITGLSQNPTQAVVARYSTLRRFGSRSTVSAFPSEHREHAMSHHEPADNIDHREYDRDEPEDRHERRLTTPCRDQCTHHRDAGDGVTILGPTNLPATVPYDASLMYARNIASFLLHLVKDGELNLNMEDEIIEQTLLTRDGQIVQRRVREILGLDTPAVTGAEQGSAN